MILARRFIRTLVTVSVAALAIPRVAAADTTPSDCVAAHESSVTLRRGHDLKSARAALRSCSTAVCPLHVREECATRLAEVEAALPTILFEVKDARGEDVPGVRVTIDGEPTGGRVDGFPLEVNPGDHVFRFAAEGAPEVEKRLTARVGEKDRHERVVLAAPAPLLVSEATSQRATPPPAWTMRKTLAVVSGGVGLAAAATGIGFGVSARASWSDAQAACQSVAACVDHPRALREREDAEHAATVATIAISVAGAAVVAGIVLWLTSPSAASVRGRPAVTGACGSWVF